MIHNSHRYSNLNISWVFFDMGGVLIDSSLLFSYIAKKLYRELPIDPEVLREKLSYHFIRLKSQSFRTVRKLFYNSFLEVAKEFNLDLTIAKKLAYKTSKLYTDFFINHAKLYPDVLPCLQTLRKRGFKLGIISDADMDVLKVEIKRLGIEEYFNVIVVSSEVKVYKPSKKIFTAALMKAGCQASKAVYIGDSDVDSGSKEVGMIFIRLVRWKKQHKPRHLKADFIVYNLYEAIRIITGESQEKLSRNEKVLKQ